MDTIIVLIIVALAAWYVGRHLWRGMKPGADAPCGCGQDSACCSGVEKCSETQIISNKNECCQNKADCGTT